MKRWATGRASAEEPSSPHAGEAGGACCSSGLRSPAASFGLVHRNRCRGRCVTVRRCRGRRSMGHATHLVWSPLESQTFQLQASSTCLTSASSSQPSGATSDLNPPHTHALVLTLACPRRSLSMIWLRQARWTSWSTRAPTAHCRAAFVAMPLARTLNVVVCLYVSVVGSAHDMSRVLYALGASQGHVRGSG